MTPKKSLVCQAQHTLDVIQNLPAISIDAIAILASRLKEGIDNPIKIGGEDLSLKNIDWNRAEKDIEYLKKFFPEFSIRGLPIVFDRDKFGKSFHPEQLATIFTKTLGLQTKVYYNGLKDYKYFTLFPSITNKNGIITLYANADTIQWLLNADKLFSYDVKSLWLMKAAAYKRLFLKLSDLYSEKSRHILSIEQLQQILGVESYNWNRLESRILTKAAEAMALNPQCRLCFLFRPIFEKKKGRGRPCVEAVEFFIIDKYIRGKADSFSLYKKFEKVINFCPVNSSKLVIWYEADNLLQEVKKLNLKEESKIETIKDIEDVKNLNENERNLYKECSLLTTTITQKRFNEIVLDFESKNPSNKLFFEVRTCDDVIDLYSSNRDRYHKIMNVLCQACGVSLQIDS